ncbi:MAG: trypsin-like peptidase domain-containing protein [Planctomycetota bacterium]
MRKHRSHWLIIAALLIAVVGLNLSYALAGTITLKDGTVLEGDVKKVGSSYTIKTTDGDFKMVSGDDVESVTGVEGLTPGKGKDAPAAGTDLQQLLERSERIDTAVRGSAMWQTWIDKNPDHPELEKAQEQLEIWRGRVDEDAEKINGKWIGGEELEDLLERVRELTDRAAYALQDEQATLDVVKDLEQARRLHPKYIPTNFYLGYWNALKNNDDVAARYFQQVLRQKPNMSETLNNIGVIYSAKRQHEKAIRTLYQAVQLDEDPIIVRNLMTAFSVAPRSMYQANPRIRAIWEDAQLLARKHGGQGSNSYTLLHLKPSSERTEEEEESYGSGIIGTGTGFFITEDGFIMTNQHVAEPGDTLIVQLSDGTEKEAERIVIDDEQDIAILKIEMGERGEDEGPQPFIPIAAYDQPGFGADVTIFGYPLGSALGKNIKVTRGVVTGIENTFDAIDIIVDATVNPGNSGGPMVDKYGRLLALVAVRFRSGELVSAYGGGLSNGRIRTFFDKHADLLNEAGLDVETVATGVGDGDRALTTEELAQRFRPAVVQIMMVND